MPHRQADGHDNPFAPARRSEHSGTPPGSRGVRLASTPTVSIVVASAGERARLQACLDALVPACLLARTELVVARGTSAAELQDLQLRNPAVLFMPAPDGSTLPALRAFGIAAAGGDIVAFTDDRQLPDPEWVSDTVALAVPVPAPPA